MSGKAWHGLSNGIAAITGSEHPRSSRRHWLKMAERQGFEPWVRSRAQRFSRPPRSTTPAPLRRCSGQFRSNGASHIESGRTYQVKGALPCSPCRSWRPLRHLSADVRNDFDRTAHPISGVVELDPGESCATGRRVGYRRGFLTPSPVDFAGRFDLYAARLRRGNSLRPVFSGQ